MKIDWKKKLSSRKFWAMLGALVISILTLFNISDLTSNQVAVIISGIGAIAVYILAEGGVDKAAVSAAQNGGNDENNTADTENF